MVTVFLYQCGGGGGGVLVDGAGPDTDYQERAMRLTVLVMVTVSPLVMVLSSGLLPFSLTVLCDINK